MRWRPGGDPCSAATIGRVAELMEQQGDVEVLLDLLYVELDEDLGKERVLAEVARRVEAQAKTPTRGGGAQLARPAVTVGSGLRHLVPAVPYLAFERHRHPRGGRTRRPGRHGGWDQALARPRTRSPKVFPTPARPAASPS